MPQWLADPATSAALRDKLALTQRMRRFAVTELGLPDNDHVDWRFVEMSRRSYEPLDCEKLVLDAVEPIADNLARVRAYLEGET